jgi:hypothetical protein
MTEELAFEDFEKVYDLVALAIDDAGAEQEALFLSKLCLTAHNIKDISIIEEAIAIAKLDLRTEMTK